MELAQENLGEANYLIANEMQTWKSRNEVQILQYVMHWNPKTGAFVSAEWEVLSQELNLEYPGEPDEDCATRIFCRILSETLKRPSQILSMKKDALWIIPSSEEGLPTEYLLRIPKAKGQSGQAPGTWQISEKLGKDILAYSERRQIRETQEEVDRLIVMPSSRSKRPLWIEHGQVDAATAKQHVKDWANRRRIISPRTLEQLHVTPYRFRHTGGITLALQGIPRELIQEIMEHDSPYSADAYIKAVGADLMPVLERSTGRGIGEVFLALNKAYFFKGSITEDVGKRPIIIPTVSESLAPAVVGSCGKNGTCNKHPLWACYNGCPHFLAWREADHQRALQYIEGELKEWRQAEGGKERSKLEKDFDRVGAAINDVIRCIAETK
jgi:integrase